MPDFIHVQLNHLNQTEKEVSIALLSEMHYEGFEEEGDILHAFIPSEIFDQNFLQSFATKYNLEYVIMKVEDRNWNQEWESNFNPVVLGDFVAIRAEFHEQAKNVKHEIVITPKMSFGTGHHATTILMIEAMRNTDFRNKFVLDFGTGTGVLAILAEKSGAKQIIAIDNDEWSIENTKENISANGCSRITVIQASKPVENRLYDIILANIIKSVILKNLSILASQLRQGGIIILSGLLKGDENDVRIASNALGLKISFKSEKGNWICLGIKY